MRDLVGQDADGWWRLVVRDLARGGEGTLRSWALFLELNLQPRR